MDLRDTLSTEHGLIRQFLDNLSLAAEQLQRGEHPSVEFFRMALQFAREFADSYHHYKEEHVMFVLLAQKRHGELDAQLEGLRHQHERGRYFVVEMSQALDGYAAGRPIGTDRMLENVAAYAALLRHHIHREDHIFFPLAWRELSKNETQQLEREFEAHCLRAGEKTFERYHTLVCDMGALLVDPVPDA